jgi:hypothetical protein
MGWRDFQTSPPREFMEFMELMPIETPLIPFIPLIPIVAVPEKGSADPKPDWRPEFKAWLTPEGELRSIGVCDDLAAEIIKLTADDMALQVTLLKRHIGRYNYPHPDAKEIPHYCANGDAWCSVKLSDSTDVCRNCGGASP